MAWNIDMRLGQPPSGGGGFVEPLWITNVLGATPTLLQLITVGTWTFASKAATLFDGQSWDFINDYGPGTAVYHATSKWRATGCGHTVSNNIFVGVDLENDVPDLVQVGTRTTPGNIINDSQFNADGRFTAAHLYGCTTIDQLSGKFSILTRNFVYYTVSPTSFGDCIDLDVITGAQSIGNNTPVSNGNVFECSACSDPATGDQFLTSTNQGGMYKRAHATGVWSTVNTTSPPQGVNLTYDTARDRIIALGSNTSWAPQYALKSEGFATWHNFGVTGAPSNLNSEAWGGDHDSANDCLWIIDNHTSKGNVRKVTFTSASAMTVSGTGLLTGVTVDTAVSNADEYNGRYSCMKYVPRLKGIVFFGGYNGGLYFFRTSN